MQKGPESWGIAEEEKVAGWEEEGRGPWGLTLHIFASICGRRTSTTLGRLGGSMVEHLPSAQGMILGSWDRVPHQAPCMESASPSAYVSASLSVCLS